MTNILRGIGLTAAILVIWLGPAGFVMWEANKYIDFWHSNYVYHKARNDYLFDGANERGLLDICIGPGGRAGVFFKEDCSA